MTHLKHRSLVALAIIVLVAAGLTTRTAAADNTLVVRDFALTRDIAGREPVDNIRTFGPADEDAIAFARLDNSGARTTVTFKWYFGGQEHAAVQTSVGNSPGWRTWSSANLKPGGWRVQLRDAGGTVLAERGFAVASEFAQGDGMDASAGGMAPAGNRFDDGMPQEAEGWPELEGSAYPRFDQEEDGDG